METQVCKGGCGLEKPLYDFYKHPRTTLGVDSKCKECVKEKSKKRYEYLTNNDPTFVEKERVRHKEKYQRLGYKDSQKEWDKDKPWKKTSIYKNLSRNLKLENGLEAHHWNYNDDFLTDVFILEASPHKVLHTHLNLDLEKRIFYLNDGTYLDTREKHEIFIKSLNLEYKNHSPL